MKTLWISASILVGSCVTAAAMTAPRQQSPSFAAPVRLEAGKAFLGQKRIYPSPVFRDMNGDGRLDIVVGDLPGRLTVSLREPGDGPPRFGPEKKLLATDGKAIDFHNW